MFTLDTTTPESLGIHSSSITSFLNHLEDNRLPMHSFILVRHDQIAAEGYYSPFSKDHLHRMFSISKSLVSLAIGQLIREGKLDLDDPIIHYFPDKLHPSPHPFLQEMTIRHMLTMQTCYSSTTFKVDPTKDWLGSFFTVKPSHHPGTVFNYDTSASHTLCSLVERLSHMPFLDYLRSQGFDQLGFSPDAYMIKDPFGMPMGGSGLMARTRDLLLIGYLLMKQGIWKNHALFNSDYIKRATAFQVDNSLAGQTLEETQGYGFQIWRTQHDGFACFGMGGQYAIVLPKEDLLLVTTADTQAFKGSNQLIFNDFYSDIVSSLSDHPLSTNRVGHEELKNKISHLSLPKLKGSLTSPRAHSISGVSYSLDQNPSGFNTLKLVFNPESSEGLLQLTRNNEIYDILFGFGHFSLSEFPIYKQKCATSAVWITDHRLHIYSHLMDECIGSVQFIIDLKGHRISVAMKKIEETYFKEFQGYLTGIA